MEDITFDYGRNDKEVYYIVRGSQGGVVLSCLMTLHTGRDKSIELGAPNAVGLGFHSIRMIDSDRDEVTTPSCSITGGNCYFKFRKDVTLGEIWKIIFSSRDNIQKYLRKQYDEMCKMADLVAQKNQSIKTRIIRVD